MKSNLHVFCFCSTFVLLSALGCNQTEPPAFHLNMIEAVSNELTTEYQQEVADVMGALFGTPDEPYAHPETGLDQNMLNMAAGPAWSDEQGANHGLYRKHCVHCHGITGDGRGPTAQFLNPYPRDYRPGIYKFKSTENASKPTDDDLHRILVNGVPGTAMPSFSLLPNSEVESLVEYVKYLSFRGQMESKLIAYVYEDVSADEEEILDENGEPVTDPNGEPTYRRVPLDPESRPEQRESINELLAELVAEWNEANEKIIVPDEGQIPEIDDRTPEELADSIKKGRELFYGKKANCYTCHGPTGLGDGQQDDFDHWNKASKGFLDRVAESDPNTPMYDEMHEVAPTLYQVRNSIPRNLRKGIYRGGNRRIDIFWKIHAGIAGTPMPGLGAASKTPGGVSEEEMWNIVDYVLSLPYQGPSQPQHRLPENPGNVSSGG